jgi:hypothetical protein
MTMPELPTEKVHAIRQSIARLRCAAHELDVLLAEMEPTSTTTALIDPQLSDFMQRVLPEDEKQRLTEILPQLADGSSDPNGAARAHRRRGPRRPRAPQS